MQSKRNSRQKLCKLRKRTIKHMNDLVSVIGNIRQGSSHPERDFARVFKDESVYSKMLDTLHVAFMESFKYEMKLVTLEHKQAIRYACVLADLKPPSDKQLRDRHYRARIQRSLEAKKRADGKSWFEVFRQELLVDKLKKVHEKHVVEETVICLECGLEQKPVENYVICKCGFQGPVIGNLYQGFSREEEHNKLKEKEA